MMPNILIAEDNESFRNLLSHVLIEQGYSVIEAGDGMEALSAARKCNGPIHLLCTNVAGSRMSGVALAERLRLEHPALKVLLLVTAGPHFVEVGIRPVAEKHPEFVLLQKPFTVEDLTAKVREILKSPPEQAAPPGQTSEPGPQ